MESYSLVRHRSALYPSLTAIWENHNECRANSAKWFWSHSHWLWDPDRVPDSIHFKIWIWIGYFTTSFTRLHILHVYVFYMSLWISIVSLVISYYLWAELAEFNAFACKGKTLLTEMYCVRQSQTWVKYWTF